MAKETVAFRLDETKRAALDAIAQSLDRDRSYVINEAIENYLEVHQWQIEEIKKAIAEADEEKFASEEKVNNFFDTWEAK